MVNRIKWALTSFHPRVTWSPPDIPDPEKSSVKTVMFEGSNIIAASLASALHPLAVKKQKTQYKYTDHYDHSRDSSSQTTAILQYYGNENKAIGDHL